MVLTRHNPPGSFLRILPGLIASHYCLYECSRLPRRPNCGWHAPVSNRVSKWSSSYEQGKVSGRRSLMALDVLSGDFWFKSRPCHPDTLGQPFLF